MYVCVHVHVCVCVCGGGGGGGGRGELHIKYMYDAFSTVFTFFVTMKEIIPPFSVMLFLRATFFLKGMDESSSRVS